MSLNDFDQKVDPADSASEYMFGDPVDPGSNLRLPHLLFQMKDSNSTRVGQLLDSNHSTDLSQESSPAQGNVRKEHYLEGATRVRTDFIRAWPIALHDFFHSDDAFAQSLTTMSNAGLHNPVRFKELVLRLAIHANHNLIMKYAKGEAVENVGVEEAIIFLRQVFTEVIRTKGVWFVAQLDGGGLWDHA